MFKWFWTIFSFGAPALWNLTLAKKLLINDKLTTSCQTTMPSKQFIKCCKQLWITVRLISFQNPELQSVSIFLNFVHPSLLLHLPCYLYLLFLLRIDHFSPNHGSNQERIILESSDRTQVAKCAVGILSSVIIETAFQCE